MSSYANADHINNQITVMGTLWTNVCTCLSTKMHSTIDSLHYLRKFMDNFESLSAWLRRLEDILRRDWKNFYSCSPEEQRAKIKVKRFWTRKASILLSQHHHYELSSWLTQTEFAFSYHFQYFRHIVKKSRAMKRKELPSMTQHCNSSTKDLETSCYVTSWSSVTRSMNVGKPCAYN